MYVPFFQIGLKFVTNWQESINIVQLAQEILSPERYHLAPTIYMLDYVNGSEQRNIFLTLGFPWNDFWGKKNRHKFILVFNASFILFQHKVCVSIVLRVVCDKCVIEKPTG